jgi:hypothetical protein
MNPQAVDQLAQLARVIVGAGLLSLVMPIFVSIVVQTTWPRPAKELTVIVSCILVGCMGLVATGTDLANIVIAAPVMVALTRKAYTDYWKQTGLAQWVEHVTDVRRPVA